MDPGHVALLNKHRVTIIRDMQLDVVVDHLIASGILLDHHENEIMTKVKSADKIRKLLTTLKQRGKFAFETFLEALKDTGQHQLIRIITEKHTETKSSTSSHNSSLDQEIAESQNIAAEEALKNLYKTSFQKVNPFSLPFTFDIENTWISLALSKNWSAEGGRSDDYDERRIDDHHQLIAEAFNNNKKLLLIEGRAASGKTSLLRRIAYDWSIGKLDSYKLVFYVEFRKIQQKEFSTVVDLIWDTLQNVRENNILKLTELIKSDNFCKENSILLLLDGYDEAQVKMPCKELTVFLTQRGLRESMLFDIIISSRPGPLSKYLQRYDILNSAEVLGFDEDIQKLAYIKAHFKGVKDKDRKIAEVEKCLNESESLYEIAETPLFLVFICLVYDKIEKKTIFELYQCIIWWLIDRYQADNVAINVPNLFGFKISATESDYFRVIQDYFLEFPMLRNLGSMAFENYNKNKFSYDDLRKYEFNCSVIKQLSSSDPVNDMPNVQSNIITHIGLLRHEEIYENMRLTMQIVFPHRTIQEFLAGGIYYYWPESKAVNAELTKKIFAKNIISPEFKMETKTEEEEEEEEENDMNELERFVWRAAFSFENKIFTRLRIYFQDYETLSLDLHLVLTLTQPISVRQLNKILSQCTNIVLLRFYSSRNRVELADCIDLSSMISLKTLIFDEGVLLNGSIFEKADLTFCSAINLSKNNILEDIVFKDVHFSAQCLVATINYLVKSASRCEKIRLSSIHVYFSKDEGIYSYEFSDEKFYSLPLLDLVPAEDTCRITDKILAIFSFSEKLRISAKIANKPRMTELYVNFTVQFPSTVNLRNLQFDYLIFSERNGKAPDIFLSSCKHLETIVFRRCEFELPILQILVNDLYHHCNNIRDVEFLEQVFVDKNYFEIFFEILQGCKVVQKLYIGIEKIGSENEQPIIFDATSTISALVKHLISLKELKVSQKRFDSTEWCFIDKKIVGTAAAKYCVIDKKIVCAAAEPRETFIFAD